MNTIKRIRLNLMLNQREFAELLGVTRQMVWSYETGRCSPSFGLIKRLMQKAQELNMNVKAEDFFS